MHREFVQYTKSVVDLLECHNEEQRHYMLHGMRGCLQQRKNFHYQQQKNMP